jgi:GT2 family glycosyltransferase
MDSIIKQAAPTPPSTMPWTGERMVPNFSDVATELFHWQRYLYFRPWYDGKTVIDAAAGEGYGANYASVSAKAVKGIDIAEDAIEHARVRYPHVTFLHDDVAQADYSEADLVVSFETIEHLPDPEAFLKGLATCQGLIVISTPNRKTHSPGNRVEDRPLNQFHTVEWTPFEFANLLKKHFPNRQVRFLSQEARWPGLIREGLDDDAMYCIAVIGNGELPTWPKLGIAIPTLNNALSLQDAVIGMSRFYPGELEFAVVANGSNVENLAQLRALQQQIPHMLHLIEEPVNNGFAVGCNIGLDWLHKRGGYDYYGVANDDVMPATDCLCELVGAYAELKALGHRPGVVGPVSNAINGPQQVDIGHYTDYHQMLYTSENYHRKHSRSATPTTQLRGLLMLISPECLSAVGGFDPRFGMGNFEDDDHNIRTRLAGFTMWIVDGAFLHHEGSATFKQLGIDYSASIEKNAHILMDKWGIDDTIDMNRVTELPSGVELHVPLNRSADSTHVIEIDGRTLDLLHQATDIEFAAWMVQQIQGKDRAIRTQIIELLDCA